MKTILLVLFGAILNPVLGQFGSFPVTLSLPYDKDTIPETRPVFVWQCNLAAIQSDPRLSLQFGLTELESGQTAAEAMLVNPALCVVNDLQSTSYSYPSTLEELKKGHTYVWQVRLLFNDQVVQESEPWQFTIFLPVLPKDQFIPLRRQPDGSRHVTRDAVLYLMIPRDREVTNMEAVVRNVKNEMFRVTLTPAGEIESPKGREENLYYVVNMRERGLSKGSYTLEWRSGKGQTYYLQFTIQE